MTEWIDQIVQGDALSVLKTLPDESVDMCITSPPYYGKFDYGVNGQIGVEPTVDQYILALGDVFFELRKKFTKNGVLWVVMGDTFNNYSPIRKNNSERKGRVQFTARRSLMPGYEKELLGVPFLLKDELRRRGWAFRSMNIWAKPNRTYDMSSDRPWVSHEYIMQFVNPEPGSRRLHARCGTCKSSVFSYPQSTSRTHPATFPLQLAEKLILLTEGEVVIDPFVGSGTTALAAKNLGRHFFGIELKTEYIEIASKRLGLGITPSTPYGTVRQSKLGEDGDR